MKSLESVASHLLDDFLVTKHNNGNRVCLKSSNSDLSNCIHEEIHDGFLPDDFKYTTTFDAVSAIAEGRAEEYALGLEPDIYTHDLLTWAASHLGRQEYLDEALTTAIENGQNLTSYQLLQSAQLIEIEEIAVIVRNFVERQYESENESEDGYEL